MLDNISQLSTVTMIFIAGMTTALMLPEWISFLFIIEYVGYQFGIIQLLWQQIPQEFRNKYNSKILVLLEWICDILRQAENREIEEKDSKIRLVRCKTSRQ